MDTVNLPPVEQAQLFLTTLFRGCQHQVELRAISADHIVREFYSVEELSMPHKALAFVMGWRSDHSVTVGVATREGRQGNPSNIREFGCLWCDIDVEKDGLSYAVVGRQLDEFPYEPTFMIHSGRGIHLYWCLENPVVIPHFNDELSMTIQGIERGLAEHFGSDMAVTDITRVMRMPGTLNLKEPDNPLECRILSASGARYSLDQFTRYKTEVKPRYREFEPQEIEQEEISAMVEMLHEMGYADSIRNGELVCSCPFHSDGRNPNFRFNLTTGLFYCWSCMEGGNIQKLRNELTDIQLKQYFEAKTRRN